MGEALSVSEAPEGQSQGTGAAGSTQESVLLSQLIALLHQRERHSLLLSDLGALLPGVLRQRVKDQGGLRSWLQRYPSLFAVEGQPGKESVRLCLGAAMQHLQTSDLPAPTDGLVSADLEGITQSLAADADNAEADRAGMEEDIDSLSAVQLRGLPYRASMEDIVAFLGEHSSDLAEQNAVQLVQNRDGRPSGFARVQFTSPESAKKCVNDLHLRSMDDRYVEVFLYSERPSKGRQRRGGHEDGNIAGDPVRVAAAVDASGVTREQVVRECRAQMADVKKRRLLLSMLGVALSPGARSYLKQMDQGLKHFLSQFSNEFSVDGGKGCEYVTYTPTQLSLSQAIDGFNTSAESSTRAAGSRSFGAAEDLGPLTSSPKPLTAQLAASPDHPSGPASATRGINTPSDWGTPYVQQVPGPTAPWVPPWPQGPPGASCPEAAAWGALPAWPMPGSQFGGWPGWPPYPPWGGNPPNLEAGADVAAAAAAAFGTAPGATAAASGSSQQPAAALRPEAAVHMPTAPPVAAVRLRGLPFTSAEQDVLAFFAQHDIVDRIADGPKAVNILTRSNGRPSGQAIVQMREPADAELAQGVLHGQWMGSRYIEVFLLSSEENEAQAGSTFAANTAPSTSPQKVGPQEPVSLAMGVPSSGQLPSVPPVPGVAGPDNYSGMSAAVPPWQLGMWSAAMAQNSLGSPPLGTGDFGPGGGDGSSWEALFEFLGPESQAAMGMPPTQIDFAAMGYGLSDAMTGMPSPGDTPTVNGVPATNGAAAATV